MCCAGAEGLLASSDALGSGGRVTCLGVPGTTGFQIQGLLGQSRFTSGVFDKSNCHYLYWMSSSSVFILVNGCGPFPVKY